MRDGPLTLRVRRREPQREAVRGLPAALPEGEHLLWQGSPDWRTLQLRAFHVRGVAVYFAIVLAWCVASQMMSGAALSVALRSNLHLVGLALVPVALLSVYAWGVARSTIYTITSRRVTISFGLVVPMTINLPFRRIEGAGLQVYPNGAGDIPLRLLDSERLAYLLVWPHARPWRMKRAEPMLRGIPDAAAVASILGRALVAHAALQGPVQVSPAVTARPGPQRAAQAA